jgi:NADPH:quinone reductase-like Zn-dependent oxidoreductase
VANEQRLTRLISQSLFNIRFGVLRLANENKSVMAFNLSYLFDEVSLLDRIMRNLLTDFDQGRLVPLPTRCYPFEQADLAHRDVQSGRTIGKCELTMGSAQPWLTLRSPGTRPEAGDVSPMFRPCGQPPPARRSR